MCVRSRNLYIASAKLNNKVGFFRTSIPEMENNSWHKQKHNYIFPYDYMAIAAIFIQQIFLKEI
jgi:hypothetical protein